MYVEILIAVSYLLLGSAWAWTFSKLWDMRLRINTLENTVFPNKKEVVETQDDGQTSLFEYINEEE